MASVIKFPVASDEWQDYVDAFSVKLGQKPEPSGPPVAVFQLEGGQELLYVIKSDRPSTDEVTFVDVKRKEDVDTIYNLLSEDKVAGKPHDVKIIAIKDDEPIDSTIRLAEFRFTSKRLIARKGGVIHNPPY
ncbi:hypothetical protein [Hymenobacter volaticus]|uniref:Uncharacterized protein n=1 Tax=Hymenobacter volaticus TaxID=2932254 RepID=A0ABY4GA35_9BACT|nr:hypothetical protein [Hymenobacter volaticus]UOQ67748.1 hypothetical protein MUN86_07760 [Hymenobacter volaticus]